MSAQLPKVTDQPQTQPPAVPIETALPKRATDGDEFWPARNVAEYAYCPRLFYYMQVEGIFLPSVDTEKGVAVHRRVDRPSAEPAEDHTSSDPDRPKVVRSLSLSNAQLALVAKLDL